MLSAQHEDLFCNNLIITLSLHYKKSHILLPQLYPSYLFSPLT